MKSCFPVPAPYSGCREAQRLLTLANCCQPAPTPETRTARKRRNAGPPVKVSGVPRGAPQPVQGTPHARQTLFTTTHGLHETPSKRRTHARTCDLHRHDCRLTRTQPKGEGWVEAGPGLARKTQVAAFNGGWRVARVGGVRVV